jgi:hypothetical protein
MNWGTGFFMHKRIISTVEFVRGSMLYVKLRGCCCGTVLKTHALTKDNNEDVK